MSDIYVTYCLAALRRQVDRHRDAVSLLKLLKDLKENLEVLTRDKYIQTFIENRRDEGPIHNGDPKKAASGWSLLTEEDHRAYADRAFSKFTDKDDDEKFSSRLLDADIASLKGAAQRCKDYVDRRIAHHDQGEPKAIPRLSEVHSAIDLLGSLVKKYHPLFRFGGLADSTPVLPPEWRQVFTVAWLDPEGVKH